MSVADTGWVKTYRKITEKGYYKKSQYVHLWIHLLLKASHNEKEFMWNGKIEKLLPGQFVTGRKQLSFETGISETTIERILDLFENEQQIGQQKTNKYRLLTVLNWNEYQTIGQQNGQLADNKRTTDGQQTDTFKNIKNDKNVKNEKNKDIIVFSDHLLNSLKIPLSDKEQTEKLIKAFGLDEMIKIVDRMAVYFNTCKKNKWSKYLIGKHWRNLYQKIEYFSSDESLKNKLFEMERANGSVKQEKSDWSKEHYYDDSISVENDGIDKVKEMIGVYMARGDKLTDSELKLLQQWEEQLIKARGIR